MKTSCRLETWFARDSRRSTQPPAGFTFVWKVSCSSVADTRQRDSSASSLQRNRRLAAFRGKGMQIDRQTLENCENVYQSLLGCDLDDSKRSNRSRRSCRISFSFSPTVDASYATSAADAAITMKQSAMTASHRSILRSAYAPSRVASSFDMLAPLTTVVPLFRSRGGA